MDKKTLKARIEIEAIVKQAQAEVDNFSESINQMWQYSAPPKKLLKQVEDLQLRIESLKQLTESGVINSSDLSSALGDYRAISKEIRNLTFEFSSLTEEQKKAFLSPQEKQEIEARNKAIANYTASLEKNKKILEEIEAIQSKRKPKNEELNTKTATRDTKVQERSKLVAPEQTDEVKEYIKNLERLTEIQKQIKTNEKTLANLRAQGRSSGKQYTNAEENLATLRAEEAQLSRGQKAYEEYTTALKTYEEAVKPLEADIKTLNGEISSLETEIKDLDGQLAKLESQKADTSLDNLKETLKDLGVEGLEAAESLDDIKVVLNNLEKSSLKKVDGQIENVVGELKNLGKTANMAKEELDNANASLREQEETLSRTQAFADRIKQFVGLAGAAQVMSKALRSSFETTKELDAVMTEMAVVTDLKVGDYWEQLPEHTKRASELGIAIKEVYEAETLYYQQGLKTNEVVSISTETLKMARIAGLSAEDATEKMTAALRGFNMELNETSAQRIADVYSELAAITAADVGQISNAMSKTASIASSAGMEFETTAAFLAQIIETTQESAETAGTAMKTVVARFQELKKDPSEIGEIDGEIVDANAIETALRSVGVSLRDANGQFRELDDVFLELSSKWDSLDKNTQRYIATIAAGSRQQSRFIAMMSDFERTQELVSAANTSAGASNKQYEKTLDSLQSKLERLKNAWTSFTQGIANSKLIKAGVDILTKLLETINKLTDSFGEFSGAAKIALLVTALYLGDKAVKVFMTSIKDTKSVFASLGAVFTQTGATIKADIDSLTSKMKQFAAEASYVKDYYNSFGAEAAEPLKEYQNALRATAKANKELNKAEKEGKKSSVEYIKLTEAKEEAIKQEKIAADKIRNSYLKNTQQQKLYDIAVKNGMQADRAAIMVTNEKVLAILREKGAIDELNNVIDENIAKDTLDTLSNSTNAASSFGKSLSDLGTKMSKFDPKTSFGEFKKGAKGFGEGLWSVIQKIGKFIASCWQLIVVLAVLVVAIVGLVHYIKYLQRNSPEGKLKAATEAADRAAEAANRATEAYKELSNGFEDLGDKYKNLENLTKGTREWREAVQEINDEVLQLISKNPELASLYENVGGVLTLKSGSEEQVEAILNNKALEAAQAQSMKSTADLMVKKAEKNVAYSKLSDDAKYGRQELIRGVVIAGTIAGAGAGAAGGAAGGAAIGSGAGGIGAVPGSVIGGIAGGIAGGILGGVGAHAGLNAAFKEINKSDQEITEMIAKDMAKGKFNPKDLSSFTKYLQNEFNLPVSAAEEWAKELSNASDELIEFGQSLSVLEEQEKMYNEAMAQSALNSLDLTKFSKESRDLITGATTSAAYEVQKEQSLAEAKELSKNKDEYADMKEEVAKAMYGDGAVVKGDKIIYKDGEEEKEVTLSKEEWQANYAAIKSTEDLAKALEKVPEMVNTIVKDLQRINYDLGEDFRDLVSNPGALTVGQVTNLGSVKNTELSRAFSQLSKEQQDYYGSEENFIKWYRGALEEQNLIINEARIKIKQYTNGVSTLNEKMNTSNVKAFTKQLAGLQDAFPETGATIASVMKEIDSISNLVPEEEFNTFMQLWNSFDHSDLEAWEEFEKALEGLGLENILLSSSYQKLALQTKDLANAVAKVDFNSLGDKIAEINKLYSKVSSQNSREFDQETYEALIQIDQTLENSFVQLGESFYYLGNSIEDLIDTLQKEKLQWLAMASKQLKAQVLFQKTSQDIDNQKTYYGRVIKEQEVYKGFEDFVADKKGGTDSAEYKDFTKTYKKYQEWEKWVEEYGDSEETKIETSEPETEEEERPREIGDETRGPSRDSKKTKETEKETEKTDKKKKKEAESEREIEPMPPISDKEKKAIQELIAEFRKEEEKGKEGSLYQGTETVVKEAGTLLDISQGDYEFWSKEVAATYVQDFLDKVNAKVSSGEVSQDILSYLEYNGEKVDLWLDTDASALELDELHKILGAIYNFNQMSKEQTELLAKIEKQERIQRYVLESTAAENKAAINLTDTSNEAREANAERSKALLTQGIQGGIIGESVIALYNDLMSKLEDGTLTETERDTLDSLQSDMVAHLKIIEGNQKGIAEITKLENQAAEALYNADKKKIDELKNINDSINDSNAKILEKVQQQINESRKQRELDKSKQSISDAQSYLTYLQASGGANSLEALSLQQEIEENQLSYQDSLIDEKLASLQNASDVAAEQRERQISTLEAILEQNQLMGVYTKQAQEIVHSSLVEVNAGVSPLNTQLKNLIATDQEWGKMTVYGLQSVEGELILSMTSAASTVYDLEKTVKNSGDKNANLVQNVRDEVDGKTLNDTILTIQSILAQKYDVKIDTTPVADPETGEIKSKTTATVTDKTDAKKAEAIQEGVGIARRDGWYTAKQGVNSDYELAKAKYTEAGGTEQQFDALVYDEAKKEPGNLNSTGILGVGVPSHEDWIGDNYGEFKGYTSFTDGTVWYSYAIYDDNIEANNALLKNIFPEPKEQQIVLYQNTPYIYSSRTGDLGQNRPKGWRKLKMNASAYSSKYIQAYKQGGLADFTGPAWLDGTKAHPEMVLNARDTQNFILLKDILAEILTNNTAGKNNTENQSVVNSIDIDINVENLSDDYDVEQLANKIRSMLYDDASYRNTNSVGYIR